MTRSPIEEARLDRLSAVPIANGLGEAAIDGDSDWPRYIRITDVIDIDRLDPEKRVTLPPEIAGSALLERDDIVMAAVGATVGLAHHYRGGEPACFAGYMVRFRADRSKCVPRFIAYWTQSQHYWDQVRSRAIGANIENFSASKYRSMAVPVPPLVEQRAIADYLDRETARIDTLIEEQQRLIEMLRERRRAVVDHEIGVQRWPLVQLRHLASVPIDAGVDEQSNSSNPAEWPRFIRTTDIESLTTLDDSKRVTISPVSAAQAPLMRDDLVATRAGATVGKSLIYLSGEPASYAGYLVRIRLRREKVIPMFAAYWTTSTHYLDQIAVGAVKSTIENYSASKYRSTLIPLPPLNEQERIVRTLDAQIVKLDDLVREAERFIELSRERRAALITAAVTGQIDVRGEVA